MTITMRQKGKKLEDGGGMVITADSWMGPKIPAMAEQMAFQQRYIQKLYGKDAAGMARDLAQAMAMYPADEGRHGPDAEGSRPRWTAPPILTVMKMESVQTPEQAQAKADQEKQGGGGIGGALPGGLGGMFGKKKKAEEPPKDAPAAATAAPKNRATIMTTHNRTAVGGDVGGGRRRRDPRGVQAEVAGRNSGSADVGAARGSRYCLISWPRTTPAWFSAEWSWK